MSGTLFLYFKGETGPMVAATLKLGIAILNGGNSTVQQVRSTRRSRDAPFNNGPWSPPVGLLESSWRHYWLQDGSVFMWNMSLPVVTLFHIQVFSEHTQCPAWVPTLFRILSHACGIVTRNAHPRGPPVPPAGGFLSERSILTQARWGTCHVRSQLPAGDSLGFVVYLVGSVFLG